MISLRTGAALVAAGDVSALCRRLQAKLTGRSPRLPAGLAPRSRSDLAQEEKSAAPGRRILMVSPSLALTGAPLSQVELARGLSARGWVVETWCSQGGPAAAIYETASLPLQFEAALSVSQGAPALYERDVGALASWLRRLAPDLVYANTLDLFPVIDAAAVAGLHSVWNIRESEPWRTRLADRHTAVAARALACFRYPRSVLFVAEASRKAWGEFTGRKNAAVIYNAPYPDILIPDGGRAWIRATLGATDNETLFTCVGTICERKGQIDIARALALVPQETLNGIRVAFVGGADPRYLARLHQALPAGARSRVFFADEVANGAAYVGASDVLINSSRSEAFPRTFFEAAAAHVAIIATAVGGAGERLRDRESALFFGPGDAAHLARLISETARDPALRRSLAAGARAALVTGWTYNDMVEAYDQHFRRALSGEASARNE